MESSASNIHEELERILATRWFKESHQLSALLRYVVGETLAGRTEGLKEYSLGLQVFHRSPDYDPRTDAIVRVQASLVRKRLAAYYEQEGQDARLRIELPRGGYVPVFREHTAPSGAHPPDAPAAVSSRSPPRMAFLAGLAAGLSLSLAAFWLPRTVRPQTVECPALWSNYLDSRVETVTGFGVPLFFSGGMGLFVRDTHVNQLSDGQSRIERVQKAIGRPFRPQGNVYTGIGDAIGAHLVARWLEQQGVSARMANCNYIGSSDVQGRNLVIVSSARFQTLLQSMELPRRIRFDPAGQDGAFVLENPLPGEPSVYRPRGSDTGVSTSYAVISLWPGISPGRRILYLSGIETWSTQGAAEFALDKASLSDLQRLLAQDPADGPRGRKSPYFQVLLRVEGKSNVARSAHYVTHRYLPLT
jgi:hypothetical protein